MDDKNNALDHRAMKIYKKVYRYKQFTKYFYVK